jgi:hypothetical protein
MGDSPLLEIALGLTFVFVLFSVLISAANELIVGLFKSRAAGLWDGIGSLLNGDDRLRQQLFAHPLIASVRPPISDWRNRIESRLSDRRRAPSYIEPRTFAVALLELLKQPQAVLGGIEGELTRTAAELRVGDTSGVARATAALTSLAAQLPATPLGIALGQDVQRVQMQLASAGQAAPQLARTIDDALAVMPARWRTALVDSARSLSPGFEATVSALADEAAGNIDRLREGIERWFDEGMDRVAGWYKRWTQAMQFGLGLALAVALNVDPIQIAKTLNDNEQLRAAVGAQAVAMSAAGSPDAVTETAEARLNDMQVRLAATGLPLGWEGTAKSYFAEHYLWVVFGWLLAALAGSLGAPFWFDLLKKVANLRASGPNPIEKRT